MSRPRITLELRKFEVADAGYSAYLIVGNARIWIDTLLPDIAAADDLHTRMAKQFAACGIDLVEDIQ